MRLVWHSVAVKNAHIRNPLKDSHHHGYAVINLGFTGTVRYIF